MHSGLERKISDTLYRSLPLLRRHEADTLAHDVVGVIEQNVATITVGRADLVDALDLLATETARRADTRWAGVDRLHRALTSGRKGGPDA